MEGQELRDGKERVRRCLIDPLQARGMVRRAGVTLADHAEWLDSLAARLAYMTEGNLAVLAEAVQRHAGGKARNRWPRDVTICNFAADIQRPPATVSRLVRSMLASVMGQAALAGGYHLELMEWLRDQGRKPGAFDLSRMKQDAEENRRKAKVIRHRCARGLADVAEQGWLVWYDGQSARAEQLIRDGAADEGAAA